MTSSPHATDAGPTHSIPGAPIELGRHLRPGDTVLIAQAAGEPRALTEALVQQSPELGGIRAFLGMCYNDRLGAAVDVQWLSYGALGAAARLPPRTLSVHMSELPGLIRSRRLPVDVLFCQVSPADADGYHHLGLGLDYVWAALDVARVVIAEVNPRVPRTPGSGRLHCARLDVAVPTDHPLIQLPDRDPSPVESAIAGRIAELVPPEATLQLGVGGLLPAVAKALVGRTDLRVHSGLIGDWVVDLAEAGAFDHARETGPPPIVAGTAVGTDRLYRFLDRNPLVEMRPVEHVHGAAALAQVPRLAAVNSALQVDLCGQVNAEALGGRQLGAVGGQVDFLRGAAGSPGGVGVVALPATGGRPPRSRVVSRLDGPVTTSRADVSWVVTEFGAVDLRGRTLQERAELMLGLAAPQFRAELAEEQAAPTST